MGVSAVQRIKDGVSAVVSDTQARSAYAARLKWLLRGSGNLPAWSLEYRAGLEGIYSVGTSRHEGSETFTRHCPAKCPVHAPLAHLYEARFTYQLTDTVVNTVTGASLLSSPPEPPFFVRESISWPFESILSHGLDIPEVKDAAHFPGQPTTVFPSTKNYYHWLIEELPLVVRAQSTDPDVRVLAHANSITLRHRSVAAVLGFDINPAPKTVRLDHHVLPGRANDSWFVHPDDASILFDLGQRLSSGVSSSAKRIYVSRRNAKRSVTSEAQLEDLLQADGFTIIRPESMSWREQIGVFQSAAVVVGPHGAGLANLAFTPPGALLVEITNGRHYNRCFEWLCHVAGHSYAPVSGDDETISTAQGLRDAVHAAIA